jgi:FkbM family methyltransferase
VACAIRWYDDSQTLRCLPLSFRLLAMYYRRSADPSTGDAPRGRYWHYRAARLIQRLRLKDTARVRLRDVLVDVDLLDSRSTWVMNEVLHPAPEASAIRALLSPGDTFIDIGANHGSYSLMAAPAVRAGRVLAFEPQPRLAALLRRSFEANGFAHARVFEVACADHEGEATFYVPRTMSGMGGLYEKFSGGRGRRNFKVPLRRLDDLLAGADLPGRVAVKLDVEGSELSALRGAAGFLRARFPLILMELNPDSARAAGHSVDDVLGFLAEIGYDRVAEPGSFPGAVRIGEAETARQRNVFVMPLASSLAGRWDM